MAAMLVFCLKSHTDVWGIDVKHKSRREMTFATVLAGTAARSQVSGSDSINLMQPSHMTNCDIRLLCFCVHVPDDSSQHVDHIAFGTCSMCTVTIGVSL